VEAERKIVEWRGKEKEEDRVEKCNFCLLNSVY
jgi:hypothetical protein